MRRAYVLYGIGGGGGGRRNGRAVQLKSGRRCGARARRHAEGAHGYVTNYLIPRGKQRASASSQVNSRWREPEEARTTRELPLTAKTPQARADSLIVATPVIRNFPVGKVARASCRHFETLARVVNNGARGRNAPGMGNRSDFPISPGRI